MADFSTHAILLRKVEYGDHDLIITFLTREAGKIAVIAKNAKQSVRRFSGALDLFSVNHIQCTFPKKRPEGMTILTQSTLVDGFANIRYDVYKTGYASYWTEMVTLWMEADKPQASLYDLLFAALAMLDKSQIKMQVAGLIFQIRFMSLSGFAPGLESCDCCCKTLDSITGSRVWFDFKEGQIICLPCRQKNRTDQGAGMQISKGTLKQLSWINAVDMDRADRIRFSGNAIQEGERLLESFIPFHLGRQFKSLGFLKQLRREI